MRIKEVCGRTGLTKRTIRYYIEEGLITPEYTENYLGRRFFDFSENDIKTLEAIITFRKFGFSISDIRRIKETPAECFNIVDELIFEKEEIIENEKVQLEVLENLENQDCTFEELAEALSEPVRSKDPAYEDQNNTTSKKKSNIAVRVIVSIVFAIALRTEMVVFNAINKAMTFNINKGITNPDDKRFFLLIAFGIIGATFYGLCLFWGLILKTKSKIAYRILCFFMLYPLILGLIMNIINVFAKII